MTERANQLRATVDKQVGDLIDTLSTVDRAALRRACPGREKLGDGTIGAIAAHTVANYERIGTFVITSERMSARHSPQRHGRGRVRGLLSAVGHRAPDHDQHGPSRHGHEEGYTADSASPSELIERLEVTREQLVSIAALTDRQLDTVPPKDSFRYCDGQRTLEQVLAGLLKHQNHQVATISGALNTTS